MREEFATTGKHATRYPGKGKALRRSNPQANTGFRVTETADITVLIVAYKSVGTLAGCLDALRSQTREGWGALLHSMAAQTATPPLGLRQGHHHHHLLQVPPHRPRAWMRHACCSASLEMLPCARCRHRCPLQQPPP